MRRFGSEVTVSDITTIGLSLAVPLLAAVSYLGFFAQAVRADDCGEDKCVFASLCYSEGACVACGSHGNEQKCGMNGNWGSCSTCWGGEDDN